MSHFTDLLSAFSTRFDQALAHRMETEGDWKEAPSGDAQGMDALAAQLGELDHKWETTVEKFQASLTPDQDKLGMAIVEQHMTPEMFDAQQRETTYEQFERGLSDESRGLMQEAQRLQHSMDLNTHKQMLIEHGFNAQDPLHISLPADITEEEANAIAAVFNKLPYMMQNEWNLNMTEYDYPVIFTPNFGDRRIEVSTKGPAAEDLKSMTEGLGTIIGIVSNPDNWTKVRTKQGDGYRIERNMGTLEPITRMAFDAAFTLASAPRYTKDAHHFYERNGTQVDEVSYGADLDRRTAEQTSSGDREGIDIVDLMKDDEVLVLTGKAKEIVTDKLGISAPEIAAYDPSDRRFRGGGGFGLGGW